MASEIRVNKINSRTGVGTITLSPTGVDFTGIATVSTLKATTGIVTTLSATGNATVGGTLSVTGTSTLSSNKSQFDSTGTLYLNSAGSVGSGNYYTKIASDGSADFLSNISIADKIIHYGDTNTAIRFPAADTVTVETAGSERLRIDSSGNFGLGTSSPGALIDAAGSNPTLRVRATTINTEVSTLRLTEDNSFVGAYVKYDGSTNLTHIGTHSAADSNTANDNNGITIVRDNRNVGIGTASPDYLTSIAAASGNAKLNLKRLNDASNGNAFGSLFYTNSAGNDVASVRAHRESAADDAYLAFATRNTGGSLTERVRITSGGGLTFNGDTSSANALDDYEEGTFTPAYNSGLTSPSYTNTQGTYIKIGRLVTFQLRIFATGTQTNDHLKITGLPFTSQNVSGSEGGASFNYSGNIVSDSVPQPNMHVGANQNQIAFYDNDGGNWSGNSGNGISGRTLHIHGQYVV